MNDFCLINFHNNRKDHLGAKQSLGLMRLAAVATKTNPNISIKLLSIDVASPPLENVKTILSYNPSIIGISVQIWSASYAENICNILHESLFNGAMIVGGPQVQFLDKPRWPSCVEFVEGEGEAKFQNILLDNDHRHHLNLSDLTHGVPLYSSHFFKTIGGKDEINLNPLLWETSRGCPFSCGFCGHKLRNDLYIFPLQQVEEEAFNISNLSPKHLFVVDPILGGTPHRLSFILDLFYSNAPQISIIGYARPESVTNKTLSSLANANIKELMVGIQTLNPSVPGWIRRNSFRSINTSLPWLHHYNVPWRAELIIGLPGDDLYGLKRTIKHTIEQLKPRWLRAYPLLLIPGTPLSNANQKTNTEDWIITDNCSRVISTYSYSVEMMNAMKEYGGAICSLYNFLYDQENHVFHLAY